MLRTQSQRSKQVSAACLLGCHAQTKFACERTSPQRRNGEKKKRRSGHGPSLKLCQLWKAFLMPYSKEDVPFFSVSIDFLYCFAAGETFCDEIMFKRGEGVKLLFRGCFKRCNGIGKKRSVKSAIETFVGSFAIVLCLKSERMGKSR